jgi:putative redox protein
VRDIGRIDAVAAAKRLDRRPLLVLHGAEDVEVPVADARALADAGRPSSELRLVPGAAHRLRHDPRAIATLLGWLTRQVPSGARIDAPSDAPS